jgi:pyruvate/2-oxoglutarate dehydrogenase complex dihydrolipoamide dehydrogenase (E3) component
MIVHAADAIATARRVPDFGGTVEVRPDYRPVHARIRDEATTDWDDQVAVDRLKDAGAEVVHGEARLVGPKRVEVNGLTYVAGKGVLLNPGTEPATPPIEGLAETPYWTNRDILRAEDVPASLVVIGGGPIGAELSQAWSRFGVQVTVLEVADRILAPLEPEAGQLIGEVFAAEGIQVLTQANITKVSYDDGQFAVDVSGQTLHADKLLVAAGRRPNLPDLGLDTVGLDPKARSVDTDERMRARGAEGGGLWAIGDITGKGAFTHMSMYQSAIAVRDILGEEGPPAAYHAVPHVTFTDPEAGGVGMTEKQARDKGLEVRVGTADLPSSTRGWIAKAQGLIKLVEDAHRGVLVGATVVGPAGGEILSMFVTAVHAEIPTDTLRSMIYAYPTFHRAAETALKDLS